MIVTQPYKISGERYLKILFRQYWKKNWMWFLLPVFFLLALSMHFADAIYVVVILLFGTYPFLLLNAYFKMATQSHNRFLLLEKHLKIDDEQVVFCFENEKTESVKWSEIVRVEWTASYYLLYRDKKRFFYVPKDLFLDPKDRIWFEQEVLYKIMYRNKKDIS